MAIVTDKIKSVVDFLVKGFEPRETIFDDMAEALSKGETVDIFGFGKFEVTERGERDGINPVTMEKIRIKASKNVKFRPSKSLKNKVN